MNKTEEKAMYVEVKIVVSIGNPGIRKQRYKFEVIYQTEAEGKFNTFDVTYSGNCSGTLGYLLAQLPKYKSEILQWMGELTTYPPKPKKKEEKEKSRRRWYAISRKQDSYFAGYESWALSVRDYDKMSEDVDNGLEPFIWCKDWNAKDRYFLRFVDVHFCLEERYVPTPHYRIRPEELIEQGMAGIYTDVKEIP